LTLLDQDAFTTGNVTGTNCEFEAAAVVGA
jgi:hypothetical protein